MSYENLKKDDDKAIFILSGLFPDNFDIHTEDLLRFGWGLGFFKYANTLLSARSYMEICVNNLLRANLLIKSDCMGCVKVHNLVRAFILNKISEYKQASIVNHDKRSDQYANESYERILLKCTGITKLPEDFIYPNLSLLMLMDGYELLNFPEDIYERMEKLKVMSYENMHIPMLPRTSEHSTKLRILCLRSCSFINDDVSFLGSLSNLEILSFVDCKIIKFPSMVGKLKKLKLLDLRGYVHLRIDVGVLQNLISLEELYMRAYNDGPIRFTHVNYGELEILSHKLSTLEFEFFENMAQPKKVSYKNLERFRISIGCKLKLEDDENFSFKNTIRFVGDYNELLKCQISDLFEKTEMLYLKVNALNHLRDHSFFNLKVLDVYNCEVLTHLFTIDVASGLKILERLTISNCPVMRTLVAKNNRGDVIKFEKLSFISLTSLPNMVSLADNEIKLPAMTELILDDLPNFTSIYTNTHSTYEMQSLLDKKVVIPRLEKLYISRMENLKHIWSCENAHKNSVSLLRTITVRECHSLINLFPTSPLPLLNHLEELVVEKCGSIEALFNMEFESIFGMGEYNNIKLRSIRVDDLRKLKELWRIRGVNKCDIHVKCFNGIESIELNDCPSFKNIFTPMTTNFDLEALTNYALTNTGVKVNAISEEEISEIDEYIPNVTYPYYLLYMCHHLRHLHLRNDKRVREVVFKIDSHQPLLPPDLEVLQLERLNETSHVWKCNWNAFLIPQHQHLQFPFRNLTKIHLEDCHKVKYLLSPLMAKYLSNLKYVSLKWCDGIEEVVSSRDDRNEENTSTFTSSHQNSTLFPCLETLRLTSLPCLKSIDGEHIRSRSCMRDKFAYNITNNIHDESQSAQVISTGGWSLCQYPTKIVIYHCNALSYLVPWYAVGQMKRLKKLTIWHCKTLMEVFESESCSNNVDEGSALAGTTLTSPTLKTISTLVVPQLSNLKHVNINGCDLLSHVFTFSTLESLKQLKELKVKECKSIQVIVKLEENTTSLKDMAFPCLETLELDDLPNLKGFFLGMNEFRWPLLDDVKINDCPQLVMFTSGHSETPKLKYIQTAQFGKYSLECDLNFHGRTSEYQTTFPTSSLNPTIQKWMPWSFHNLIEINIEGRDDETAIVPSNVLLQLEKLEKITIKVCSKVKEVFEVEALEGSGFNESQTTSVVKLPNLKQVKLYNMNDLKYLWKSTRWMVLEFPNLTTLYIESCHNLEHVFTCSMIGSLVQLQDLCIGHCKNIKVIVKEEEEECDAKVNEIMLPLLKSLKLDKLPSLEGFCLGKEAFSLPSLDTLLIKGCPTITVFTKGYLSTRELKVIDTETGKYYVMPDLNSFIITTKQEEFEDNDSLPWTNEEEMALANSWVHVKNANEPLPDALEFWHQVHQQFHLLLGRQDVRACYELRAKWRSLKKDTVEFCKIFTGVFNNRQCVWNEQDILSIAQVQYNEKMGMFFNNIPVWRFLKDQQCFTSLF